MVNFKLEIFVEVPERLSKRLEEIGGPATWTRPHHYLINKNALRHYQSKIRANKTKNDQSILYKTIQQ